MIQIDTIEPHPNADTLGLVHIDQFVCAVRLGEFQPGDLAVYIEPDYVAPDTEQFEFLGKHRRIKVRKLRGIYSQGLLVPAPPGSRVGDDVMESMGITRYEPPPPKMQTVSMGPQDHEEPHESLAQIPKYDLENWRRYSKLLNDGESVYVTEKMHGTNARYAYRDGRMWCGSRSQWKKQLPGCLWWRVLESEPWVAGWCEHNQDSVLYGEIFGRVQDLTYGAGDGEVWFRAFDVLRGYKFLDAREFIMEPGIRTVPLVALVPYSADGMEELALRNSTFWPPQIAEGIVIKPAVERWDMRLGRVALKLVSNAYLSK